MGKKLARVALPPLAWDALARYLAGRELPILPVRWRPETPVIGSLETDSEAAISSVRLWGVLRRFFLLSAQAVDEGDIFCGLVARGRRMHRLAR